MTRTIYKPFTPSTILDMKEISMTSLFISCGGGIGGAYWTEYTADKFDLNDKFICVNTNISENEAINTENIVKTTPVKIVALEVRNDGNENLGEYGTVKKYYYVVNSNDVVVREDCFGSNPESVVFNTDII